MGTIRFLRPLPDKQHGKVLSSWDYVQNEISSLARALVSYMNAKWQDVAFLAQYLLALPTTTPSFPLGWGKTYKACQPSLTWLTKFPATLRGSWNPCIVRNGRMPLWTRVASCVSAPYCPFCLQPIKIIIDTPYRQIIDGQFVGVYTLQSLKKE